MDGKVPTNRFRNVVLLGHGGTGKTTLGEALLRLAATAKGRGSTFDAEPEEQERGRSLSLATASLDWRGHRINILDAPGSAEAYGDAFAALPAADLAVFVVDASAGVQAQHDELWAACDELGLPRLVFLNQFDKPLAAYQTNIDALRERCGKALAPVHMPMGVGDEFTGVIDLLHFTAVELRDGERIEHDITDERLEQAQRNRDFLVEAIVENDDDLLLRYLDGDTPTAKELGQVFARGIAGCGFFPVLCGSATQGMGDRLLADFIVEEAPAPAEADGVFAAYVAKTMSDPYLGRINLLRVLSGELRADETVEVQRTHASVRPHQIFTLQGRQQAPVRTMPAGGIVAVAKLDDVRTGDVLCDQGATVAVRCPPPPEPQHRVAIVPASSGDEDKLSTALARLTDEDPALRVDREAETHQMILRTYGPVHTEVTLARLARLFGVTVDQVPLRIAYRETVRDSGTGVGRHVKQSGGHGQYGVAHIEVAPLPHGEGFRFTDSIVGGVIPHTFIPSVRKGVEDAMSTGVLAGYPVADVAVTLFDGKHHSVDSSDMAFQMAGALAFRAAAREAGLVLLEPLVEVEVAIPDELTGDVMGDLSARRGRIQGTEQSSMGRTTVRALVPQAELLEYIAELRSLTSGTGSVRMRPGHYEEAPEHIARKVIAEAEQLAS